MASKKKTDLPLRKERYKKLSISLQNPKDQLHVDGLLDAVLALYHDCDHTALKRNKNFETFRKRYEPAIASVEKSRLTSSDFQLLEVIGRGAFGEVQLVRMKETSKVYAMKILSKFEMIRRSDTAFFWEERDIMAHTESPWIVKLRYAFQDINNLYMVMDYMPGGNMVSLMERYEIPEDWAQFYIAELVLALEGVHSMGYIHRDIKPDNMLMDARGHLRLADFGTCMKMDKNGKVRCETAVGTPDYISPEVLKSQGGEGYYGAECDWWSVGVVMYEMLIGDLPFFAESLIGTYSNIMNHKETLSFKDENISPRAESIIRQFLENPDVRLGKNGPQAVKKHSFFEQDQWTWDNIQNCVPPVVPELKSDHDTQYFDVLESSNLGQTFPSAMEFQGNHLPFIGFTFQEDVNVFTPDTPASTNRHKASVDSIDNLDFPINKDLTDSTRFSKVKKELENTIKAYEKKVVTLEKEVTDAKEKLRYSVQERNEIEKNLGLAKIDGKEAQRQRDEALSTCKILESRIIELQATSQNTDSAKLLSELETVRGQLKTEALTSSGLKESNQALKKNLTVQNSLLERLEKRNHELTEEIGKIEGEAISLQAELDKEKKIRNEIECKNEELSRVSKDAEERLASARVKLTEAQEEAQKIKRLYADSDKEKTSSELSLKTLQQRYDQLNKNYEKMVQQVNEQEYTDLHSQLRHEVSEREKAEDRIGKLEHKQSVMLLDLSNRDDNIYDLKSQLQDITNQYDDEKKKRCQAESEVKQTQQKMEAKLASREQELRKQLNELKTEKQKIEDTIYRLKSESSAHTDTLIETRSELEEEKRSNSALKAKVQELEAAVGASNEKDLVQLKNDINDLHSRLSQAQGAKTAAEAKLADFEKEKLLIELDVKELIARHKTEVAERMARATKMREQMMILENKLGQKNNENEELQDHLTNALMRLEALQQSGGSHEEEIKRLHSALETERILKKEAVNKLAQIMYQRTPGGGSSSSSQKPPARKAHEREIRKLRGDLQQETQKYKRVVEKYQQQLEEIQRQIMEEASMRAELQHQLQQSEFKLQQLQQGISSGNRINGVAMETDGGATSISPIYERETLNMQIPKGNDARKKGWKDVYVVLSYTSRKLLLFDKEEDMGSGETPLQMLEFSQIYSVRSLKQGEHERVRVKPSDATKVLHIAYVDEASQNSLLAARHDTDGGIHVRGHHFAESRNPTRSACDVCSKPLPLALLSGGIYECKNCQMKCHKDDIDKVDLIQPCVTGEQDQKKLLLLVKSDDNRQNWLSKLSKIASTAGRPVTPSTPTIPVPPNAKRDRGGSMRFDKRPGSAQTKGSSSHPRSNTVSQRKGKDDHSGRNMQQVEVVRNMDPDSKTP